MRHVCRIWICSLQWLARWWRQAAASAWALACALAAQPALAAEPAAAITLSQPGTVFESAPYSLGFAFSVSAPVSLVSLGVYDDQADGLEAAAEVALWRDGAATPERSVVVAGGQAATLEGGFRYAAVAPYALTPGQLYVVASYLDGGWATSFGLGQQGVATVSSLVQLLGNRFADGFFALAYPAQSDGSGGAWLGANFQLLAVPEPATAWLLAAGCAGLVGRRRVAWVFSRICRPLA